MNDDTRSKKKFKLPSAYTTIMIIIVFIAILSWIVPGGSYEYIEKGKENILQPVPGSFSVSEANKQGIGDIILAPINGFLEATDIILYTLVIGGFLSIVMKTGALDAGIGHTIKKLEGREKLLIPSLMFIFAFAGAAFGIEEETLPFFPIIIPILLAAGYDTLVGLGVVKLGAALGVMGSIANPFAVAIGSRFAGVSIGDGIVIRLILLAIYIPSGIFFIMRYAEKVRKDPTKSLVDNKNKDNSKSLFQTDESKSLPELDSKRKLILTIFILSFLIMIWGVLPWEELGISFIPTLNWWFPELSGLFLASSVVVAIIAKFSEKEFIDTFIKGAKDLLGVAIIIGVARGVTVIMNNAKITDTVLYAGERLLSNTSSAIFSVVNYFIYLVLSILVPSSSGLATLSMGIMAPLADFANVPRHLVVTSFAAANAMISIISPTVGLLMGVLQMTDTSYATWIKFVGKFMLFIGLSTLIVLAGATIILT